MKIAVCLYGQPRDYDKGYENINNFIQGQLNKTHTFDFFIHCWGDDNVRMECSPWRNIDKHTLVIRDHRKVRQDILNYYHPLNYTFEKPITRFDLSEITNSLAYQNTHNSMKKQNIHNTLSQMYSRNKVKNILQDYIAQHDDAAAYDMVMNIRIDYQAPIHFQLEADMDKTKTYVSRMYFPRYIIPDNFILCPLHVYLTWFGLYDHLSDIINNREIDGLMKKLKEVLEFNMEEMILSNYLLHFDIKDVVYDPSIKSAF
jgi:hypothetical protein